MVSTVDTCPREGRWFGGCRWEPRYDVEAPTKALESILARQWSTTEEDRARLVRRATYRGEACTRCGRINFLVDDEDQGC